MATPVVAVLDIGKTNKKVSLYNEQLETLADERTSIDVIEYNGLEVEDTETLLNWFKGALKKLSGDCEIKGIAVTAHGATFVVLGEDEELAHPVISYTEPKGAEVQEEFYEKFGTREELLRKTSTADIGFCNMAKVLYYIKTRLPESWPKVKHGLFYGPYFGHVLTGKMGLEPTFVGNHTYFWDFEEQDWSDVARELGADKLFAKKQMGSWDVLGTVKPEWAEACGLPADCKVTPGIHDSNANYLPYLAKGYGNFLLNSTGTWCVLMRAADQLTLSDDEIAAKVFFNQDAMGRPVRTSLMTGGLDYDTFSSFTEVKDESDLGAVSQVVAARDLFVVPGVLPDATAFPGAAPRVVQGDTVHTLQQLQADGGTPFTGLGQQYRAALNLGLALATAKMLGHCGITKGTTVFIEGGFSKNKAYGQLLAALCPEQEFAITNLKEGTSFGAALTGWMAVTGESLEEIGRKFEIETVPIPAGDFGDLAAYKAAFDALVTG